MDLNEELIEIDDQISDFDPEDLDGVHALIEQRQALIDGAAEDLGPELEEPPKFEEPPKPDPDLVIEAIAISRDPKDEDYVLITSNAQRKMIGGGDIRDGAINLKAGVTRRKLQKNNREGFITLNEEKYEYD